MIGKDIEQITEQDLQALVDNAVAERKTVEYKQSLPDNTYDSKKEFLADVSSFANASGGDLIYGMSEDAGIPISLDGIPIENADDVILRLENIIRDGIEPRIPTIATQPVSLSDSNTVLIIRVPRSWSMPHRVTLRGHDKFYGRSSNGKYPLDVGELRTLFNVSATLAEQIKRFREDRISSIVANESFVPLTDDPKIVLHLIPMVSFNLGQIYDFGPISALEIRMRPMNYSGIIFDECDQRYNLDGLLTYSKDRSRTSVDSYVELFRNGIIEALSARIEALTGGTPIPSAEKTLCGHFENVLVKSLRDYCRLMNDPTIEPPIVLFLSLLGVRGYTIDIRTNDTFVPGAYQIDRDIMLLPEVIIEGYDMPAEVILKPCFDSIWNACGVRASPNYDSEGQWRGV